MSGMQKILVSPFENEQFFIKAAQAAAKSLEEVEKINKEITKAKADVLRKEFNESVTEQLTCRIKIRFNTEHDGSGKLRWRVCFITKQDHWIETLADEVFIDNCPVQTTTDTLKDGRVKDHITITFTCYEWDENKLILSK